MHALIIEDESMVALAIEEVLRCECGFTSFDIAPSAHAAIVAAAFRRPDIITSDVRLKRGCGISAVESICDGRAIPTIFITGNAADVTRRLPTFRVLEKPFSETALVAAVASAMLDISDGDARNRAHDDLSFGPRADLR